LFADASVGHVQRRSFRDDGFVQHQQHGTRPLI
jgi:hypothetical protein